MTLHPVVIRSVFPWHLLCVNEMDVLGILSFKPDFVAELALESNFSIILVENG